jgi:hypothetical protein
MGTLISTYTVAAVVVGVYAGWLVVGTRRLSRRLNQVGSGFQSARDNKNRPTNFFKDVA